MFDWFRRMNEDQAEKVVTYCAGMIEEDVLKEVEKMVEEDSE